MGRFAPPSVKDPLTGGGTETRGVELRDVEVGVTPSPPRPDYRLAQVLPSSRDTGRVIEILSELLYGAGKETRSRFGPVPGHPGGERRGVRPLSTKVTTGWSVDVLPRRESCREGGAGVVEV